MDQSSNLSNTLIEAIAKRYNLVTQDEFYAQARLLEESLSRIADLEQQLAQLENPPSETTT